MSTWKNSKRNRILNIDYIDPRMKEMFKSLIDQYPQKYFRSKCNIESFIIKYSTKQITDFDYDELCNDSNTYNIKTEVCFVIQYLVSHGFYKGVLAELISKNIELFNKNTPPIAKKKILCGSKYLPEYIRTGKIPRKTYANPEFYNDYNYTSEDIHQIFIDILKDESNRYEPGIKEFVKHFCLINVENIEWQDICDTSDKYMCWKIGYCFITKILEKKLYKGKYSSKLYSLSDKFTELMDKTKGLKTQLILCGPRITGLHIIPKKSVTGYTIVTIDTINPYLDKILLDFWKYQDKINHSKWMETPDIVWVMEQSFNRYRNTITKYQDFNEKVLWEQVRWFRSYFKQDTEKRNESFTFICQFYRWLVNKYNEYNFFKEAQNLTKTLLFTYRFNILLDEGYYFAPLKPQTKISGDKKKVCFIMHGMNKYSTKLKEEDSCSFDLSEISTPEYREYLWAYIISIPNIGFISGSGSVGAIAKTLTFFEKLKKQPNYPNPSLFYFTSQEAVLYKTYIENTKLSLATKNARIAYFRSFLKWCKDSGFKMDFDSLLPNYLTEYAPAQKNSGNSIPDNELTQIMDYIINDMKTSHTARLCYAVMSLLLETKFRCSSICHLTTDCIHPTIKPNQYRINTYHKTGHGKSESFIVSENTYRILMDIIEDTEPYRQKCNIEKLTNYIFLRKGNLNNITLLRTADFTEYLKSVCRKLNLPAYTAMNLRDTHMTKALEYILKTGKSDAELSTLTGHRQVDTTKSHYIDWNMDALLEATYGLDLNPEDYANQKYNIVEKIPSQYNNETTLVAEGCGHCMQESSCILKNNLPCISCNSFVTTVDREPYFLKAIENIDRLISIEKNEHRIEDLKALKELYVLWLKAIYKYQEQQK